MENGYQQAIPPKGGPFKRRKRTRHTNLTPVICIGTTALLFLLSLGFLLHRCSLPPERVIEPQGNVTLLSHSKRVQLQLQEPQLPNGCEVTSLAMLLGWAGYPVDKEELYWEYLPRQDFTYDEMGQEVGGDPEQVYVGDASTETAGWYCMEGPIVEAGNLYLQQQGSARVLEAVSGLSRRDLDAYLEEEIPLVAWVTLDYESPFRCDGGWYLANGSFYNPYCNLHCVVVLAQGEEGYLTANPLTGWQWVDEDQFWSAFDAMGRRAVVVTK